MLCLVGEVLLPLPELELRLGVWKAVMRRCMALLGVTGFLVGDCCPARTGDTFRESDPIGLNTGDVGCGFKGRGAGARAGSAESHLCELLALRLGGGSRSCGQTLGLGQTSERSFVEVLERQDALRSICVV